MSLTFDDIDKVGDEQPFLISGKDLKELLSVTRQVRSGPTRQDYALGGILTRVVCNVKPATGPDVILTIGRMLGEVQKNVQLTREQELNRITDGKAFEGKVCRVLSLPEQKEEIDRLEQNGYQEIHRVHEFQFEHMGGPSLYRVILQKKDD